VTLVLGLLCGSNVVVVNFSGFSGIDTRKKIDLDNSSGSPAGFVSKLLPG
jgi:hypothetical protein